MHRARSGFTQGKWPVIYNFFRGLRPTVDKFQPDIIYFVLEGRPKRNLELLPSYKGSREVDPEADPKKHAALVKFHRQKSVIIEMIEDFLPIVTVQHPDYEADDVMAELAHQHAQDDVVIVSGDSDMLQVLQEASWVRLWHPIKKKFLETPEFNYILWKALRGDPTDDIPGLKGVGDKTAHKLLQDPNLLEARFAKHPGDEERFQRNRELVQLQRLGEDFQTLNVRLGVADFEGLKETFSWMGFKSMIKTKTWKKYVDTFKCISCNNPLWE
jgi:5'-3' exonuclease